MRLERNELALGGQAVSLLPASTHIRDYTAALADKFSLKGADDAFAVFNAGRLVHQHAKWQEYLPRVAPYYAVKCNNDPLLLSSLADMGLGFDCASKGEIATMLDLGVSPERIVYANPCKPKSHIRYATQQGIDLTTFDNDNELYKVKDINPSARLILRIAVSDPTAVCQLNLKFGCEPVEKAHALLKLAALLELNVVGISFHVGSGCRDPTAYKDAIAHAARLFGQAADLGHCMDILDLGGGYPGYDSDVISFEEIANVINGALDIHFPVGCATRIIAEPGRFYAASTTMSCVNVVAKSEICAQKITKQEEDIGKRAFMYYVNDGVYGSFNCILYDHVTPIAQPLRKELEEAERFFCSVWGPTCDSMDCIYNVTELPEFEIGDWMIFDNVGAYTMSAFAEFNGFEKPKTFYYITDDDWKMLKSYTTAWSLPALQTSELVDSLEIDRAVEVVAKRPLQADEISLCSCTSE